MGSKASTTEQGILSKLHLTHSETVYKLLLGGAGLSEDPVCGRYVANCIGLWCHHEHTC